MFVLLTGGEPELWRQRPRRQKSFEVLANACRANHMELMVTTPASILADHGSCQGFVLDVEQGRAPNWKAKRASLQGSVVYDGMFLADLKLSQRLYRHALRKLNVRGIPVFNPALPGKDVLHAWLAAGEKKNQLSILPKTFLHLDADMMFHMLRSKRRKTAFWFKPVYGSGGRNMLRLERIGKRLYHVQGERFYGRVIDAVWTEDELRQVLRRAIHRKAYLLQREVPLIRSTDGRKVDFRVTVARGFQGIWAVTGVTARFARPGGQLTNYHAGGTTQSLMMNLDRKHGPSDVEGIDLSDDGFAKIINAALQVARRTSEGYPGIGVLGIDVGLTRDGRVYVYDCNRRPGRDLLTDAEVELTMQQVARFGAYLLNRRKSL